MKELRLRVKSHNDYNLLVRLAKRLGIEIEEVEEEAVRNFASDSDAFAFWDDPREDLYQDYLKDLDESR